MADSPYVVFAFLFPVQSGKCFDELLREFFLSVLILESLLVVRIEIAADGVLAIVHDG